MFAVNTPDNRTLSLLIVAVTMIVLGADLNYPLMLAPFILIGSALFFQRPEWLLYTLAAVIPWSAEISLGSFAIDVPDEPFMLCASFVAMALWISKRRLKFSFLHPLLLIVVLQFFWTTLTVITSTNIIFSLKFLLAKSWYLLCFLAIPLLIQHGFEVLKKVAIIFTASLLVVTIVTVVRHAATGFEFATINDAVVPFFRNHVVYGAQLAFGVVLICATCFLQYDKKNKWMLALAAIFFAGALFFSFSRGAWLAVAVAIPALVLLKKQLLFASFILFVVITIAFTFWLWQDERYLGYAHDYRTTVYHERFDEHLTATYEMKDVSTAERFYRWIAGMRLAGDHLVNGTGPTTFFENYKSYAVPLFRTWVSRNEERSTVHNYFLLVLIEQGVVGLLLLLILIGAMFRKIEKIYHGSGDRNHRIMALAFAAMLVIICVVNFLSDLIETDKVGSVFYWLMAMMILLDKKLIGENC